jgi:two-component system sensor histidine kinase BaeS
MIHLRKFCRGEVMMRLSIRRKLIGTLMLVGLLPLALSLVVILGGGATMRLHSIRNEYELKAADTANQITDILTLEIEELQFHAQLPQARNLAQEQTLIDAQRRGVTPYPTQISHPDAFSTDLDKRWPSLTLRDDPLRDFVNNPLAERLRVLANLGGQRRHLLATDAYGELIAADTKTGNYLQAGETWWDNAFDNGKGRLYISSVEPDPATGNPVVSVAVPIYDENNQHVLGILKSKIDINRFREPLRKVAAQIPGATAIVFDERQARVVLRPEDNVSGRAAQEAFLSRGPNHQQGLVGAILGELVLGSSAVPLDTQFAIHASGLEAPRWVVIVSKPAQEAMTPIYRLALLVAAIGIALILVLFIVGVAIANREIIMPILRLREATAAVARGELNIRVLSEQESDATFRADELGELAQDFDNMTRELQKSVGQLHRGAESRQRFMELAGHELRTPVTYILGVCQLAQRQLQPGTPPPPETATSPTPAPAPTSTGPADAAGPNRATALAVSSLAKIASKAQRLSRIIENLLKLVNNEQFTTRLIKEPVDMKALIQQVCNDGRPFLNERKQTLLLSIADNLPVIEADRDKLEDALTNLLSNAIRFSPDGSTVKLTARPVVGDMLEILVEDSGPGIPAAEAASLFEPFYTGVDIMHHHSGTIEYGSKGIGLGLAIVRRFVEIHGGVVRAHSVAGGKGTQFQILLPLPNAPISLVTPPTPPAAPDVPAPESP